MAQQPAASAHLIVYKAKPAYHKLVPVTLSADGKSVTSFPDPKDIRGNGTRPVQLHGGYFIDNRGVNANTAFLGITYDAYAKLPEAPAPEKMPGMIRDKHPIKQLCDCGLRTQYKDPKAELNRMIDNGTLMKRCKQIK